MKPFFVNGNFSVRSVHVLMTLKEYLMSSDVVLSAHIAKRRKYKSLEMAGIR